MPRDPGRGDRFENLVFYGDPPHPDPALREPVFADSLKSRFGITFRIAGSEDWHDYSRTDCVLAVRKSGSSLYEETRNRSSDKCLAGRRAAHWRF